MASFLFFMLLMGLVVAQVNEPKQSIRLKEIKGRSWLVDSNGNPFFAHGVTHINHQKFKNKEGVIAASLKELGFNSYGYGCPPNLKKELPYIEGQNTIATSTYRGLGVKFVDIFDPKVQKSLDFKVKKMCAANKNISNLIGYCWTDLGAWPLKNTTKKNWVNFIRQLPNHAPGKKAYEAYLSSINVKDTKEGDSGFLRLIAREYFRVMGEANKKYDPDHIIFGDRFAFNTVDPVVMKEMLPWVDAIAIQPPFSAGFPRKVFDEIHKLTGKPILICDFAIRFKDGDKKIKGQLEESPKAAGQVYSQYLKEALETPYIIGSYWCNPSDSIGSFNKSAIKQGLLNAALKPRPTLVKELQKLNVFIKEHTPASSY